MSSLEIGRGMILTDAPSAKCLGAEVRVLEVQKTKNRALIIDRKAVSGTSEPQNEYREGATASEQSKSVKRKRPRYYIRGPRFEDLGDLDDWMRVGKILVMNRPAMAVVADADWLSQAPTENQRAKRVKRIAKRDRRMAIVDAVLKDQPDKARRSAIDLVCSGELPERIQEAARLWSVDQVSVYGWLHQFWAGGSQANALMPNFQNCGSPGQPKKQSRPLGRRARSDVDIPPDEQKFLLTEDVKQMLGLGYLLVGPQMSEEDAYWHLISLQWADHVEDPISGKISVVQYPHWRRPTPSQFRLWGKKYISEAVLKVVGLNSKRPIKKVVTRGGSEQDMVAAFGQQAGFDGTSSDVYFARHTNRLKKLPPLTRSVLRETRLGIIFGFYVGWDAPSPKTAALTILCGADTEKHVWINQRFGLNLQPGDIPGLVTKNYLADNGELKAQATTEGERQFGYSVEFTPTHAGYKKGGVESSHNSAHKRVDHKLPGTTKGKQRSRGEVPAVVNGLLTYHEYMRVLIEYIVDVNTKQLVPELAPDDFLLQDPPVPPTRINIMRWMQERDMDVSLDCSFDDMQALLLPEHPSVIRKNGLYLKTEVDGYQLIIPRLRFSSDAFVNTGLMQQARTTSRAIQVKVRFDKNDLTKAYLPHPSGLIRLENQSRDETIKRALSLDEWLLNANEMRDTRLRGGKDERAWRVAGILGLGATLDDAKAELKRHVAAEGKTPSQAKLKAGLKQNVVAETEDLKRSGALPGVAGIAPSRKTTVRRSAPAEHLSDDVMDQFHSHTEAGN